jgi:hypothetical protein
MTPTPTPIIVGTWRVTWCTPPYTPDDVYTIYADHTAIDVHTLNGVSGTVSHGTWTGSGYEYIWNWDFGPSGQANFIDHVTVSADGNSITYYNQYGVQLKGERVA